MLPPIGEHGGDGAVSAIFCVSKRGARRGVVAAKSGDRPDGGDPGDNVFLGSRECHVRNLARRLGYGRQRRFGLDRISYAGCQCSGGSRDRRQSPSVASAVHSGPLRNAPSRGSRRYRCYCNCSARAWQCFSRQKAIRAARDHHPSDSPAARTVTAQQSAPRPTSPPRFAGINPHWRKCASPEPLKPRAMLSTPVNAFA